MNHFRIYQLDRESDASYMFMDFKFAKKHNFSLDDYYMVYECNRESESLDKLFEEFNIHKPHDFAGHSLSVSDIVELNGRKWYCDSFGWFEV